MSDIIVLSDSDLGNLTNREHNNLYNHNGFLFHLATNESNTNIIIRLTGYRTPNSPPLSAGSNTALKNGFDSLILADKLISDYSQNNLLTGMHLSTPNHLYFDEYVQIISNVLKKSYSNIIFYGVCSASYPSVFFASYFNAKCLISNPILYIDNFRHYSLYKNFTSLVSPSKNVFIKDPEHGYDIEKFIINNGVPKSIYCLNNIEDSSTNDAIQFSTFMNTNYPNVLTLNNFKPSDTTDDQHLIFFPDNTNSIDIIKNLI
jgi:hypothetical protein